MREETSCLFLPSTLIAVTGADGRSVEILVKFSDEKGELPTDEEHANQLYQNAYRHILPIYQSVIHAEIASQKPSILNTTENITTFAGSE